MKPLYTAEAVVTGGRDAGHARTSDGAVELDLRTPPELGGPGGGANPEQLFAIGYAACFESALKTVARRSDTSADDARIDARVSLVTGPERTFSLAVAMDVTLPSVGDDEAVQLVRAAHEVCPYSNATRGNIDVALSANGRRVDEPQAS
ncbi:MAG: lipoyl-dependent peroxiredoxin [Solirubrobacteraceae bacterium]|nr:lipoyl-dependent peroxiredoxin [Solirubrobacteraceae bacterium]